MAHALPCCGSSAIEHRLERGLMPSTPERRRTSLSLPWPTSWHVLPGLYFPAATTTDPSPHNNAEKTRAVWKRYALSLSRTTTKFPHRSLYRSSKDERTVTTA